jgi:hypothetical protein
MAGHPFVSQEPKAEPFGIGYLTIAGEAERYIWSSKEDQIEIKVRFDPDGRVITMSFSGKLEPRRLTTLEQIRSWLRRHIIEESRNAVTRETLVVLVGRGWPWGHCAYHCCRSIHSEQFNGKRPPKS